MQVSVRRKTVYSVKITVFLTANDYLYHKVFYVDIGKVVLKVLCDKINNPCKGRTLYICIVPHIWHHKEKETLDG